MVMWNQPQLPHIWRFSLGGLFNHNLQIRILVVQQNVSFFITQGTSIQVVLSIDSSKTLPM